MFLKYYYECFVWGAKINTWKRYREPPLVTTIIHYITHIIQKHTLFLTRPPIFSFLHWSHHLSFKGISFIWAFIISTSVSFFSLPVKSLTVIPSHLSCFSLFFFFFCSLAFPPFTSDISQMAYSNWNLPLCQDKTTSASPKRYTIKLKFDSLLRSVSITVLLLVYLSFLVASVLSPQPLSVFLSY